MKRIILALVAITATVALAAAGDKPLGINTNQDKDLYVEVNKGGTQTEVMRVQGSTGAVTLQPTGSAGAKVNGVLTVESTGTGSLTVTTTNANANSQLTLNATSTSTPQVRFQQDGTLRGYIRGSSGTPLEVFNSVSSSVASVSESGALSATSLSASLGSASAPSFSFSGDSNTGIYSSGADTLNLATGGSSRATVNSSGVQVPGTVQGGLLKTGPSGISFQVLIVDLGCTGNSVSNGASLTRSAAHGFSGLSNTYSVTGALELAGNLAYGPGDTAAVSPAGSVQFYISGNNVLMAYTNTSGSTRTANTCYATIIHNN